MFFPVREHQRIGIHRIRNKSGIMKWTNNGLDHVEMLIKNECGIAGRKQKFVVINHCYQGHISLCESCWWLIKTIVEGVHAPGPSKAGKDQVMRLILRDVGDTVIRK